jgi:hypothetical protein
MLCAPQKLDAIWPKSKILFKANPEGLCIKHCAIGCEIALMRGGYWVPSGVCDCGELGIQVCHAVPILADSFRCRACGRFYGLEYRTPRMLAETPKDPYQWDPREDRFDFWYSVRCKACCQRREFQGTIVYFTSINEIKIGPKGMELEWDCFGH